MEIDDVKTFSQKIASRGGKNGPKRVKIDDVHTFPEKIAPAGKKSLKSVKMFTLSGCKQLIQNAEKENTGRVGRDTGLAPVFLLKTVLWHIFAVCHNRA
jgi:hypothetical protein